MEKIDNNKPKEVKEVMVYDHKGMKLFLEPNGNKYLTNSVF